MKKYEKEIVQAQLNSEKAVLKRLEQNYEDALAEVNNKIAILLGRGDADQAHVIYQLEYQRALKAQIEAIIETLHANEFQTVSEYITEAYKDGHIGALYSLQQQGVPFLFPIDQEMMVNAIQHETMLSESLYSALGKDTKALSKQIASEITRGLATGAMYADIARDVAAYARIPRNNAMRIVRTEAHRINEKAKMDVCYNAKSKGADVVKQWDAVLDKRTRESHVAVHGEIRELDEKFSNGLMYPGAPGGRPEEVINCRCFMKQRAKWALDRTETKMIGNIEGASDDQLKAISKKLGIPADDLKLLQGQVVPVNAKSLGEFKREYNKVWNYEGSDLQKEAEANIAKYKKGAQQVRSNVPKIKVTELQSYTSDGITYNVDNKYVILDSTEREKAVARIVGEKLGKDVSLVPRVVLPKGVSTPDYIIGNEKYDLKEPTGKGKNVLYNMIHKKKSQANNFIFDISKCPLGYDELKEQVEGIYASIHTSFIDTIIIIKDGKVIDMYKKGK